MKRIVFMGTPDFSVPILQSLINEKYEVVLVVTQPDRPRGRKRTLTPPPVKVEAIKQGIPVFQPEKLKEQYEEILAYDPDLIVTAAYGQILPTALLNTPKYGCINVHASLLPELRGGAPIHYAILEGKKETGVTIMYMVDKLDAGDILTQTKVTITPVDHVGSLHDKLSTAGATLLIDTLPQLWNNSLSPIKQVDSEATFARNITREQEKIDWQKSNVAVYNHIRGLHPWPVAFTIFNGKPLKIWWGEMDYTIYDKKPGEVVHVDDVSFTVQCGNKQGIRVTEIQPSGKKKMPVKDFLHGSKSRITIGMYMGASNE